MAQPAHQATIPSASYEDIRAKLSGAPSMAPQPTSTNIRAFLENEINQHPLTSVAILWILGHGGAAASLLVDRQKPLGGFSRSRKYPATGGWIPQATQQKDMEALWKGAQTVYCIADTM